jgi:Ca-activated chloride channel family protein
MMHATLSSATLAVLLSAGLWAQSGSDVRIVEPTAGTIAVGPTAVRLELDAPDAEVREVAFFVDGHLVHTSVAPPWTAGFDAGHTPTAHHVRVVARFRDGRRAVANVRTRALDYTESVRVNAVQVPVVVRDSDGRFVPGLGPLDFVVKENGVPQALTQAAGESVPLEVVLAIDISASMNSAMGEVIRASSRFVDRLRPDDSATILAFNDNRFVVVDRGKDAEKRRLALGGLQPWGGTALFDAIAESLDLAARGTGRKGVVVFSDGEDQASRITSDDAIRRIQQSDVMVYTIAFGVGANYPVVRKQLEDYAAASGGRVFFPKDIAALDKAFAEIISELSSQYLLSYEPSAEARGWRKLEVDVNRRGVRVRSREGYLAASQ